MENGKRNRVRCGNRLQFDWFGIHRWSVLSSRDLSAGALICLLHINTSGLCGTIDSIIIIVIHSFNSSVDVGLHLLFIEPLKYVSLHVPFVCVCARCHRQRQRKLTTTAYRPYRQSRRSHNIKYASGEIIRRNAMRYNDHLDVFSRLRCQICWTQ